MKWIVAGDLEYYPWVFEFDSYEEAKKYYDESEPSHETVWLAEVKERKEDVRRETF